MIKLPRIMRSLLATGVLLAMASSLRGQVQPTPPRWQEAGFGMSLQPPAGAVLTQSARNEDMLRMVCPGGPTINFSVRQSELPVKIDAVARQAINVMQWSHARSVVTEQRLVALAGRAAARLRFQVPDDKKGPWVLLQTLIMLDDRNVAVLYTDADLPDVDRVAAVFDAVVASVQITDPKLIQQERAEAVQRAEAVLKRLTAQQISGVLQGERWFRIIENDLDVGYMRINQFRDTEMEMSGVRVDMQVRLVVKEQAVDTLGNFFLSDDDRREFWSVRTTVREKEAHRRAAVGQQNQADPSVTPSWAETGLRSDHEITVTVQTPSTKKEHKWERPPAGYLSHALQTLMPMLLPRRESQSFAFYSYYPNATSLVLRTERIEPQADKSFRIYTRASPEEPESVADYDAKGRFVRATLSDGRVLLPSTARQIQTIWTMR